MAKILTDKELGEIVQRATTDPNLIEDASVYARFLRALAELICDFFGGDPGMVSMPDWSEDGRTPSDYLDELGWCVSFYPNDSLPEGGGIFKDYDTDVIWKDGDEK